MGQSKPFGFDLVVRDPFVAAMKARQGWIPFDGREMEFSCDRIVELAAGRVVVVGDVENPFKLMGEGIVDAPGAILLMDHIRIMVSRARKDLAFQLLDPL